MFSLDKWLRLVKNAAVLGMAALLLLSGCSTNHTDSTNPVQVEPVVQVKQEASRTNDIFDAAKYKDQLTIRYFDLQSAEDTGDSILIETPDGKTMLIDAGIPQVGSQVVKYLDKLNIEKIDVAVNTHPHADHIGGFAAVLQSKEISTMVMENLPYDSNAYRNAVQALQEKKVKIEYLEDGATFHLGKDVSVEVLNPPKGALPGAVKRFSFAEVNNQAMVLKLTYKEKTFLFTGDIYKEREYQLVDSKAQALKADMMHVPHHGNKTSSSPSFVKAVSPQIAIISSNILQSSDIVKRYENNDAKVYVTGLHGNILITSDGKEMNVITEKDWSVK
ncbi:ComEC/Rec2 family competence protein [Paenibacillus sp. GCM10027629]|uniref:ComEC/Rec2 family competence protein n=1 Tax=Paenibacillus sp. GCM10027629 TaxID=3273414 RepID=UPI00363388B7